MSTQTIAAIGTGLTNSGISIIRISGPDSLSIINKIFKTKNKLKPNNIIYGKIVDNTKFLDNVLVSYFKAPKSFTGEDICEINCHGGIQITKEILELVLKSGAVLAKPGEFSKRAFLNGKMDLSQAQAIINLINAKTQTQSRIASNRLQGQLSNEIERLREELIELLAHIEVSIDYPEYDYEEVESREVVNLLHTKINHINKIIESYEHGKIIKEGVNVAILGKPNVGKSSLLNHLAGSDKAIVTDIAGTTRDIVDETINIGELVLNMSDTAGIRDTDDIIEKIGVEKSLKKLDEVDLVLYMLNVEDENIESDLKLLSKIQNKGLRSIVVINKMDRMKKLIFDTKMEQLKTNHIKNIIPISIFNNEGIEELKKCILELFDLNDLDYENELIITDIRDKELLLKSVESLNLAKEEITSGIPIDLSFINIKNATSYLGQIIGKDVNQEVVNKIFEKFCLGK